MFVAAEVHVVSETRSQYLRNNKRGGLKNLRCFPQCLESGHHPRGFCGNYVDVKVRTRISTEPSNATILALGRFLMDESDTASTDFLDLDFVVGKTYESATIQKHLRQEGQSTQPLYIGNDLGFSPKPARLASSGK